MALMHCADVSSMNVYPGQPLPMLSNWLPAPHVCHEAQHRAWLMGSPVQDTQEDAEFAIVFAAMGVNMETAHFFKQVGP